ncbi:MAG TPA: branched-chain amino acid ABC transporter permease [Kribbella sp.]
MQNILFGLITGSLLAVATAGFALLRNTERFLHIAHGQFMALGALLAVVLTPEWGLAAGVVVAIAVTSGLGVLSGAVFFDPVKPQGGNVLLFTSIGLAWVIYALMIAVFGQDVRIFEVSLGRAIDIGPVSIAPGEMVILGVAAAVVLGLWLLLTRTALGRSIRAVASNRELAQVRGVPVVRVTRVIWALSSGLAAAAGILLGILGTVTTELGWSNILLVLAAAVLGGTGNILGVIAASLVLGVVMDASALVIDTAYRPVVAFVILIAVLVFRPEGLFSVARRREMVA